MSYNSDDYFLSNDFKSLLNSFKENEATGAYSMFDPDELIDIAEYYYNKGDTDRAEEIVERTLCAYPGSAAPLLFKARSALIDNNDTTEAKVYTELIEDKTDLEYFYMKAEIMLAEGDYEGAEEYLERQFNTVDDDDRDYFAVDASALFFDYDDLDYAEKWLEQCEDTELLEYKEQVARIMMAKGEYEKSSEIFNELIDQDPFSTQYWNALASSQFFSNKIEESIKSSEYSIALNPNNASALLNKANGLYNLGNYEEALDYFARYVDQCPTDVNGHLLTGLCHLMLEEYTEAIVHLRIAEHLADKDTSMLVDISRYLAFAYARLNLIDECMAVLDKAVASNKESAADLLIFRGCLLMENGNVKEAKKNFLQAMEQSNYSLETFTKFAITAYEFGAAEMAYNMFKLIYRYYDDCTNGYAYYAACCHELGKTKEFIEALPKAAVDSPENLQSLLGNLFPKGMNPNDYYKYMKDKEGVK